MKKLQITATFEEFINGRAFNVVGMDKAEVFQFEETIGRTLIIGRFWLTSNGTDHHCNVEDVKSRYAECYAVSAFNIVVRFRLCFAKKSAASDLTAITNAQANNS
jgi:hypothetical protein